MRFDDATPEDLIRDMEDIHPHVRIKAVSTCARALLYKPPPVQGNLSNGFIKECHQRKMRLCFHCFWTRSKYDIAITRALIIITINRLVHLLFYGKGSEPWVVGQDSVVSLLSSPISAEPTIYKTRR